tara:strand:- start:61031 stop:61189 length:159 start_codon:yes stop_codon:yes gene_type:complete
MSERTVEQLIKEVRDRIFLRYADINGKIQLPNSYDGDVMALMLEAYEKVNNE